MSSISLPPPHFHQHREAKQGGKDEGCIGILNDFYSDGIKWHDIECRHKKPIICQESQELLDYALGEDYEDYYYDDYY